MRTPLAALALTSFAAIVACSGPGEPRGGDVSPALPADAPPAPAQNVDGSAPAPSFCGSLADKASFCSDFDGAAPFAGWLNDEKSPNPGLFGGGTIAAIDSGDAVRGTIARFTAPALLDADARSSAFLAKVFAPPTTIDLAFALRVNRDLPASGSAEAKILALSFGTAIGYVGFQRSATATELFVAERVDGKLKGRYAPLDHLGMAKGWAELSLHVHNAPGDGGSDGEVTATLGASSATLALPAAFRNVVDRVELSLGISAAHGPLDGFEIDLDAVRISTRD